MVLVGVVQSLMALSTISPNLSEQFGALVSLAVVTNVVPYIMAISGLMLMMKKAGTPAAAYRRNVVIALIAMLYSTYAIYASGLDAVLGGMLVMASGYVIYGFIAHRFAAPAGAPERIAAAIARGAPSARRSDARRGGDARSRPLRRQARGRLPRGRATVLVRGSGPSRRLLDRALRQGRGAGARAARDGGRDRARRGDERGPFPRRRGRT